MAAPKKTMKQAAALRSNAAKAPTGKVIGGKGKGPVYEVPKPVRPRTAKK